MTMPATPSLSDAERYVGRFYVEGEFDCASLAVLVQRELFGREIDAPAPGQRARGRLGQARDLREHQPRLADSVPQPSTGDAALFWGVEDGEHRRWHVGTVFLADGETWVLHCADEARGSVLQRLQHVLDQGLHLEGFYAWRAEPAARLDLAIASHPLTGRVETRSALAGRSLAETLRAEGVTGDGWTVCVGGIEVPARYWGRVRVKPGQVIEARAVMRKQVLQIVAIIAISYFTLGMGGMAAGSFMGLTGAAGWAAAAAVYVGGSMLVSAALAPKMASAGNMSNLQPPPTYALQGGRNSPRLWESMTLMLGECKVVPDTANQPFTWFEGEDQYLSAMFHAGINCRSVSALKLGASAIENYQEVNVRRYGFPEGNSGTPPVLGTSVDTVEGGLLDAPDGDGPWVTRTTSPNTARFEVDIEGSLQDMDKKGKWISASAHVAMEYRVVGGSFWTSFDSGALTNTGPKPLRRTIGLDVQPAQYEVRLRKTTKNAGGEEGKPNAANTLGWQALKSYQPDLADYGGQPRVELRMKATGQLNGAPDEVNWLGRAAGMDYWNGAAWVTATEPGASGISNPGAQILLLLRGIYRGAGPTRQLIAGRGLSDNRIDIDSLKGFMVHCAAKGYRFDMVVQETMDLDALLNSIAAAGLGTMSRHSGRRGVVWNAEGQPIEGVINMAAMKARSFSVRYDLQPTADEFQLEYFDADRGWIWQPIRVLAPGVTMPQRPSRENVRGINYEAHASTVARYQMAQNIFGRKSITFEMDLEHLAHRRGAVIALSHDLTQWGCGGALYAVELIEGGFVVTVDEPVPTTPMATRMLGLHFPGEQQMRVFPVSAVSADGRHLTIAQAFPAGVNLPASPHDVRWIYDFKATPGYRCRIVSIEPVDNMKGAQITVMPEPAEFWEYVRTGAYLPPPNNSLLDAGLPVASNLKITRGRVMVSGAWTHQLTATWDARGNYDHAQVWAARAGQPLERLQPDAFGTSHSWTVPSDQTWSVEVRPFDGLGRMGTRVSELFADPADAVGQVQALAVTVEPSGVWARWLPPRDLDAIGWSTTQVRIGATWALALPVFEGRTDSCNLGWLQANDDPHLVWAAHQNVAQDWSTPVVVPILIEPPTQPVLTSTAWRSLVELTWTASAATQPMRSYELRRGDIYADAEVITVGDALGFAYTPGAVGTYMHWVTGIDVAGNRSAPGYDQVEVLPDTSEAIVELQEGLDDVIQDIIGLGELITQETADRGTAITEVERLIAQGDEQLAEQIETVSARASGYVRGNMIRNGGFERGMEAWAIIAGATFVSYDSEYGRIAQSNVHAATGHLYSEEFIGRDNLWYTAAIDVELQTAGAEWQIGIWFYGADHVAISAPLDVWRPSVGFVASTSEYRQSIAFERQAPVGTRFIRFILYWRGMGSQPILLRAAKVEQGRLPATSYITGAADVGTLAAVSVVSQATADVTGKVNASWTLALTAGGKIAGVKFMANGAEAIAAFLFDRITFAINDADANPKQLLTLGLVGGVPSVGVAGNMYLDGTFTARMIGANEVRAVHIRTDEIEARHMKVGSVTADKISVGVNANMLPNSSFVTLTGWTLEGNLVAQGATKGLDGPSTDWYPVGGHAAYIAQPNANAAGNNAYAAILYSDPVPVEGGGRYCFSAFLAAHRCNADVYIAFYNAAHAYIDDALSVNSVQSNFGGGRSLSGYLRCYGFRVAPPTASYCRIIFRRYPTLPGNTDSYAWVTQPMVEKAGLYQTVPSAYAPSGQTSLITPETISTPNLSSISAVIGLLRTATSGQRSEIDDNGHRVYNFNNVLVVRTGAW